MPQYYHLNSDSEVENFNREIAMRRLSGKKTRVIFEEEPAKQRTPSQNNSLHMWLTQVATTLNAAGLDMNAVLKEGTEIPWTQEMAKNALWKPVQTVMTGNESTTELSTTDCSAICDTITRHIGQKLGVMLPPWPDKYGTGQ